MIAEFTWRLLCPGRNTWRNRSEAEASPPLKLGQPVLASA